MLLKIPFLTRVWIARWLCDLLMDELIDMKNIYIKLFSGSQIRYARICFVVGLFQLHQLRPLWPCLWDMWQPHPRFSLHQINQSGLKLENQLLICLCNGLRFWRPSNQTKLSLLKYRRFQKNADWPCRIKYRTLFSQKSCRCEIRLVCNPQLDIKSINLKTACKRSLKDCLSRTQHCDATHPSIQVGQFHTFIVLGKAVSKKGKVLPHTVHLV